ncbi:hypothetical protein THRCLA_05843 [Thraustotheca clavata]|uniref:Cyclic nucleotide-binding domain-containing protein n=1 Tax=Thraustotheca clavata TaxID=74557 RepID=A0A1V9ZS54_9STRA|nr:hypothetical protein THRCLA_05843 [Thraustotheca clavata]
MAAAPPPTTQPTLKVMRLYKPRLNVEPSYHRDFELSSMLLLPDSFGNIYLGETFSSYISVINQFSCNLQQVGLTAKLQTPTTRSDLIDTRASRGGSMPPPNPIPVLSSSTNLDMAVEYELNEVGVHTLRVGVSYLDPITSEPKSLRKFYRFNVLNPLTITFKHLLIKDESFVESKIQNITQAPLHIETVHFLASPPFQAVELANVRDLEADRQAYIGAEETLQRVFKVSSPNLDLSLGTLNLGRLEVSWKSCMGESGRLQTQPIMRKVGSMKEASFTIVAPTDPVCVGVPFVASVVIQNNGSRAMNLQLQLRRELMTGIVSSSLSHQNIGVVGANSTKQVKVELLPLIAGLQQIQGAFLVELETNAEFPQEKITGMAEFTGINPASNHRRWIHRKGAVAPAISTDFNLMKNRFIIGLMNRYSNSNLAAFPALEITSGSDRWPCYPGYIGSLSGPDMLLTLNDSHVAGHHTKLVCQKNCYFIEPIAQHSTYLQISSQSTHRSGFPLQKGDVIELSELFIITVIDIQVETTHTPAIVMEPIERKVQFSHVNIDNKQLHKLSLAQKPKLQSVQQRDQPKLLTLQLQRKPNAYLVASRSFRKIEPVQVVESSNSTLLIGSLPGCDLFVPELYPIHAKIQFNGTDFILFDMCNATRVFLRHPVQLVVGDKLVLGQTTLKIEAAQKPIVIEAGLSIQYLRNSMRKKRKKNKYNPIHIGIPREKTLHVGRAPDCNIALAHYPLKLLQFIISHTQNQIYVMPLFGTLNQGLYYLLHRNNARQTHFFSEGHAITPPMQSSGLQLTRDMVVKIGVSELEIVAIKEKADCTLSQGIQNKYWNERIAMLQKMPWLLLHSTPFGLAEVTYLAYHIREIDFQAGDTIYKQGEDSMNAYIVLQGSVLLHKSHSESGNIY